MVFLRSAVFAGVAGLLAACEAVPVAWRPELVPIVMVSPAPAQPPKRRSCPPLAPDVSAEARRLTLLDKADTGTVDLTAALMVSEVQKNERLREVAQAYERCRRS